MNKTNEMLDVQRTYDERYRESCVTAITDAKQGTIAIEPGHGTHAILIGAIRKTGTERALIAINRAEVDAWTAVLKNEGVPVHVLADMRRPQIGQKLDATCKNSGSGLPAVWLCEPVQVDLIRSWCMDNGLFPFSAVIATDIRQFLAPKSDRCRAMQQLCLNAAVAVGIGNLEPGCEDAPVYARRIWGPVIEPDLSWAKRPDCGGDNGTPSDGIIEARENVHGPDPVLFKAADEHVKLFARLNLYAAFDVDDTTRHLEIAPAISWKRPFGNSGGIYDACCILGYADEKGEVADRLYKKAMYLMASLPVAVQCFAVSGRIAPGTYRTDKCGAWFHYRNVAHAIFWKEAIESCAQLGLDAAKAAEFVANAGAKGSNPYHVLADMREYFQGTEENRLILKEFEGCALERFESCHDLHGYDREAALSSLICGSATMPDDGWPFVA